MADLRRIGPGVYRTVTPPPISGSWKSLIRIQQGRARGDVPVYLPADPAVPVPAIAAEPRITRAFVSDTTLMQCERKHGIPGWLWSAATSAVLAIIVLLLLLIIGWGLNRIGERIDPPAPSIEPGRRRRAALRLATTGAGR